MFRGFPSRLLPSLSLAYPFVSFSTANVIIFGDISKTDPIVLKNVLFFCIFVMCDAHIYTTIYNPCKYPIPTKFKFIPC